MLIGEAINTNFIVFGLTRSGLESTIYRTQGKHANHYSTDVVNILEDGLLVKDSYTPTHRVGAILQLPCPSIRVDSSPDRVKPKTIKLVFIASPISMQH
jgi:D-alanyl-D-alanine dipeptidase